MQDCDSNWLLWPADCQVMLDQAIYTASSPRASSGTVAFLMAYICQYMPSQQLMCKTAAELEVIRLQVHSSAGR